MKDNLLKEFFAGIDSDGTVFDSMTIKHRDAFIPTMIKVWNLAKYSSEVKHINEWINLYSVHRGVNRFLGLKMAFDYLKKQKIPVPQYDALTRFIDSKTGLSNRALMKFMQQDKDKFLQEVLAWSTESDSIFMTKTENLQPFSYVQKSIEKLSEAAEIVIVSSASSASLNKDWKRTGLDRQVTKILGQENGTKAEQMIHSINGRFACNHILMIGDAIGDYEAVQKVGGLFYPIIPGKEVESWKRLFESEIEHFVGETYEGECEKTFLNEFLEVLR